MSRDSKTLSRLIYEEFVKDVAFGTQLHPQTALAAYYSTTRDTVRAALELLASSGMVHVETTGRYTVSDSRVRTIVVTNPSPFSLPREVDDDNLMAWSKATIGLEQPDMWSANVLGVSPQRSIPTHRQLRLNDGKPCGCAQTVLSDIVSKIAKLESVGYEQLDAHIESAGIPIVHAVDRTRLVRPSDDQRSSWLLADGDLIQKRRVAWRDDGAVLYVQTITLPGYNHEFEHGLPVSTFVSPPRSAQD